MSRVATIPLQQTMSGAIQRSQLKLAKTQEQLASGKKAQTYADLGTEAVRNLSAHSLAARQEAQSKVAGQVGTTLSLYGLHLDSVETSVMALRDDVMTVIGTGDAAGLNQSIKGAFEQLRQSLNATEGGVPLFAGSRTDALPFKPKNLSDLVGLDPADAFGNDDQRASARVADGLDIEYGITASEAGGGLFAAFRTLAEMGSFGTNPTDAQMDKLREAVSQIDTGLTSLRSANADNGRKQAQMETLGERADQRVLFLQDVISKDEDADLGQVAVDIAQHKTVLEASYSVFGQLANLSLVNYLR